MNRALDRLLKLDLVADETGQMCPRHIPFDEAACAEMDAFRSLAREWERGAEDLLLSFIGKLPGMVARLSLLLAFIDWATEGGEEPREIGAYHFARAAHLIEGYLLPIARRAYADAAMPRVEFAAIKLVKIIREQGLRKFSTRELSRLGGSAVANSAELDPVLELLAEAECIRRIDIPVKPQGGRPQRLYSVNPAVHGEAI